MSGPWYIWFKWEISHKSSRYLSTTNFRTSSISMLHNEQNNMPLSTWNVLGGYFLALLFAVMFIARCDRVFTFEEALGVLTTKLFMIVFVSCYYERNYILQAMIKLFLRRYLHWKYWGIFFFFLIFLQFTYLHCLRDNYLHHLLDKLLTIQLLTLLTLH